MTLEPGTIIVAHPDDEFLGAAKLFEEGLVNRVIVLTPGSYQITPPFVDPIEYTKIRRDETYNLCAHYGVANVNFLNYPDNFLSQLPETVMEELGEYIETQVRLSPAIYFHSFKDPHPDHRIINMLVHRVFSNGKYLKRRWGAKYYTKYAYEIHIQSQPKALPEVTDTLLEKRHTMFRKFYPSQESRLRRSGFDFSRVLQNWFTPVEI